MAVMLLAMMQRDECVVEVMESKCVAFDVDDDDSAARRCSLSDARMEMEVEKKRRHCPC